MHLRVLHRLSTPLSFNNVPCIKGNSILQNAGTFHVQRIENKVNLQSAVFLLHKRQSKCRQRIYQMPALQCVSG